MQFLVPRQRALLRRREWRLRAIGCRGSCPLKVPCCFVFAVFTTEMLLRGYEELLSNATMLDGASGNSQRLRMLRGVFDIWSHLVAANGRSPAWHKSRYFTGMCLTS